MKYKLSIQNSAKNLAKDLLKFGFAEIVAAESDEQVADEDTAVPPACRDRATGENRVHPAQNRRILPVNDVITGMLRFLCPGITEGSY